MTTSSKGALPLWRHHHQVVLPVVFIFADGSFVDSVQNSEGSYDNESSYISEVARCAHEQLQGDGSAVDAVHYVLNEFSRSGGRWPSKRNADFYQSAFFMDGDTKRSGAVGCYRSQTVHAVDAARHVLDKTEYNLLCGENAQSYCESVLGDKVDYSATQSSSSSESGSPEESAVYDSAWPLFLYVIAADRNGSIACGSFDEQRTKEKASMIKDSILMGSALYADSQIGSAITISLNKTHKASGLCLAWLTTQLMRDYQDLKPDNPNGVTPSLSNYLSNSLRRYVDEPIAIFALHKAGSLPQMKLSIFSFAQPQPCHVDMRPNKRKSTALSLVSGGPQSTPHHFYWSTILADINNLSSTSLFDAHPYGSGTNLSNLCHPEPLSQDNQNGPIAIIVHGGAGANASSKYAEAYIKGVKEAVLTGYKCLAFGGLTAVQAVREAVRVLENNPVYNAGFGSSLTRNGRVEMDAMLQDGLTGRFGAVGSVKGVRNVIDLCSSLLDECNLHETVGGELLVGGLAHEYAKSHDIELCDEAELISEKAKEAFEQWQKENAADIALKTGTVGAVAIDRFGNVAAATSTGGLTGKIEGRIGDTPLPGCGTAADNRLGAVSATGIGEHIMGTCVARACLHFIENGCNAQQAAELAISHLSNTFGGGSGGLICVAPYLNQKSSEDSSRRSSVCEGNESTSEQQVFRWGFAFNTEGMCWAAIDESTEKNPMLYSGLLPGEINKEPLTNLRLFS